VQLFHGFLLSSMSHAPGKERATNRIRRARGVVQRPPVQDFSNPVRAKPRHVRLSHALAYFIAPLVKRPLLRNVSGPAPPSRRSGWTSTYRKSYPAELHRRRLDTLPEPPAASKLGMHSTKYTSNVAPGQYALNRRLYSNRRTVRAVIRLDMA